MSEKRVILLESDDAFLAKKQRIAETMHKEVKATKKTARKKKSGIVASFKKQTKEKNAAEPSPAPAASHTRQSETETIVRQTIAATGVGSRSEIGLFREDLNILSGRIKRASALIRNQQMEPAELKKYTAPMQKIEETLREIMAKFESTLLANTTLTALEAERWRNAPNSRIHGLVMNTVEVERSAELSRRLLITPLPASDTDLDIVDYKNALAHDLAQSLNTTATYEMIAAAQNAVYLNFHRLIEKAPTAKRIELKRKLEGLRDLHKEILANHVHPTPHNLTTPLQDPLVGVSIVPPM